MIAFGVSDPHVDKPNKSCANDRQGSHYEAENKENTQTLWPNNRLAETNPGLVLDLRATLDDPRFIGYVSV